MLFSPAEVIFTSHRTQSCWHSKAIRPVSEKNKVLALIRLESAATNESLHSFKTDAGTCKPGSKSFSGSELTCGFELSAAWCLDDSPLPDFSCGGQEGQTASTKFSMAATSSGSIKIVSQCS